MSTETSGPNPFPENKPFWDAAARGELLIKRCLECGEHHFYPRSLCPFCASDRTEWVKSSGRGTVYSFTVARNAPVACAPVVVELEEKVRLSSAVFDADVYHIRIGQEVQVRFRSDGGRPQLAFTTLDAQRGRAYAESAAARPGARAGVAGSAPTSFKRAAVVGAGTMGIGITAAFVNAGIPVTLLDQEQASLERGLARLRAQYMQSVERNRLSASDAEDRLAMVTPGVDIADVKTADVVVEAVWEQMALKRRVFQEIDKHAAPHALLGTNTSSLDINEIAAATQRPDSVVGLHFFTPAHVMKLLEVVQGARTSEPTISRSIALARRLEKVPVVVEVCRGFAGNRMFGRREREARRLVVEGAMPDQVDRVLREFGMPMGSFELADLTSGIELGYRRRQESGEKDWLGDRMFESGRLGQKVGKGFYRYEPGKRKPLPDPEMLTILEEASAAAGLRRRPISDSEILDRLLYPMINEGTKLIEEGVVARVSDIDVVWLNGYGWPSFRGGPMFHADEIGIGVIYERLTELERLHGEQFQPSALMARMAAGGQRLQDLPDRVGRAAGFLPKQYT